MIPLNISEKDYKKLLSLLKEHQEIYGVEGETMWTLEDLNNLQQIGKEIIDILNIYIN
jgi:hypothetical protein